MVNSKFFFQRVRLVFIAFLLALIATAQSKSWAGVFDTVENAADAINLTVSGAHRTRYETLFEGGSNPHLFSLRTNIHVEAGFENFRIGGELMDSRSYGISNGASFGIDNEEFQNSVEPIQYYLLAKFEDVAADGLDLTIKGGRFTLDLGSGRLFGRNEFRNTVETFRGGQINLERGDQSLLLFYAQPLSIDPSRGRDIQMDTPSQFVDLFGAHYVRNNWWRETNIETYVYVRKTYARSIPVFEDGTFSFNPVFVPQPDTIEFTPGVRMWRPKKSSSLDFEFEFAPQFSHQPQGFGYLGHAEVGYEFDHGWRPHISALFDIASGDGELTFENCPYETIDYDSCSFNMFQEGSKTFNPLFGRLSDDFGPTGLFRSNSNSRYFSLGEIARSNYVSPGIRLSAEPGENLYSQISFRGFWREDPRPVFFTTFVPHTFFGQPVDTLNAEVGYQIDAKFSATFLNDQLQWEAGGAIFIFGEELNEFRSISCVFCTESEPARKYLYTSLTARF